MILSADFFFICLHKRTGYIDNLLFYRTIVSTLTLLAIVLKFNVFRRIIACSYATLRITMGFLKMYRFFYFSLVI